MIKEKILNIGFFKLARNESLKVDFRARIGSVLVKNGKPVSVGRNKPLKTHPLIRKYDSLKTLHSEFDAIIGIDRHLVSGSTLYVYRERKDGTIANSCPCDMCMKFLRELKIKRILYTIDNGYKEIRL